MTPAAANRPRLFEPARDGLTALGVGALMLLSAISEGIGAVLLVPLLGALGTPAGGRIERFFAALGVPIRLEVLLMLFVALVAARALVVQARTLAAFRFEARLVDGLRQRAWRALIGAEWRALLSMRRAGTVSLLGARLDQVGDHVNQLLQAASGAATLAGLGLAALAISPRLAGGLALSGAAVLLGYHAMRRRAGELGQRFGEAHAGVHGQLDESLGALRLIKGLGREDRAIDGLADQVGAMRRAQRRWLIDAGKGQFALQAGGAALLALLVWLALARWHLGMVQVLPMVAIAARALPLLGALQQNLLGAAHSRPALDAALDLIARAEAAREGGDDEAVAPVLNRTLRLESVSVRFAGASHPSLERVDLEIPARGIVAVIGPSGAGKSTLADLLGGLIEPDAGKVTVDGAALEGAVRRAWRQRVAYVQQEPVLFAASLRENLLWASPEASEERLHAALRDASAGFALDLPQGLDTPIGDGGRALSGGERQRLMLARALLRDPALLVLDEATSALDAASEAQVAQAIAALRGRMTVVVIGHRGALLALADQAIELDAGRIVPTKEA
ncbi:MAG: ABC transporter ATP-binding protein [Novosphingobium sp.]|uniref:ABC transporter ATP-binding protein n=1 Tax=Novosphingobium sp. TaxID=1874826 RepID=UPI001DC26D5D|nr:ABC transporter ATP-binding protein [Novosphingobium sp.]MCB2056896.1 ABC transporter ATP-binding protein [Novosphingobium sp.]MCP5386321.1 ABC transporter ATP-binding protein [Novosphingobium sp.]